MSWHPLLKSLGSALNNGCASRADKSRPLLPAGRKMDSTSSGRKFTSAEICGKSNRPPPNADVPASRQQRPVKIGWKRMDGSLLQTFFAPGRAGRFFCFFQLTGTALFERKLCLNAKY